MDTMKKGRLMHDQAPFFYNRGAIKANQAQTATKKPTTASRIRTFFKPGRGFLGGVGLRNLMTLSDMILLVDRHSVEGTHSFAQ
ncbi:hypothetical protein NAC44_18485 [Allorhizobium sp. BGMRC 0089]|uniref:hypothetical protein n=1 Tax=Allorhizobium sonneratiae TaxID=2934936 RepID=UPI0020344F95|nr:hypothetical protein [Allorhizobium sonneratiae]MCM2294318.1 hypothetical protein [Allorhizobium sonneratiae]